MVQTAPPPLPPSRPSSRWRVGTFASLANRDFRYLWLSVVLGSGVFWLEQVALAWVAYELTDSPFVVGVLSGMRGLPFLFFSPVAGVLADRLSRMRIMVVSQVVILGCYGALVGVLTFGNVEVWHLMVFSLGSATAWSFNQPARNSLVPLLLPREQLTNAVALQTMAHNITRILGPTAAGALMASVGVKVTFLVVTLVLVGVMVTTLQTRVPPRLAPSGRGPTSVWQDLGGGFVYVRDNPLLRGLMVMALVPIVLGMSFTPLLPMFARDTFGTDARGVGEFLAAGGVGSMFATLAVASLAERLRGRGRLLIQAGVLLGLALIGFAASGNYQLSLVMMLLVGLFSMVQIVITSSSIQMLTPREFQGRVMSIYMLDRGLMPFGSFAAGAIAEGMGAPFAMAVMGGGCLAMMAAGSILLPEVRDLE